MRRAQLKLDGIKINGSTIHRWAGCYAGMMGKYAARLRVDAGCRRRVDEIFFKILKKKRCLFVVMDGASGFILSYETSACEKDFKLAGLFAAAASNTLPAARTGQRRAVGFYQAGQIDILPKFWPAFCLHAQDTPAKPV